MQMLRRRMVLPFALQVIAFSHSTGWNVKQKNKILEIIPSEGTFFPGKILGRIF